MQNERFVIELWQFSDWYILNCCQCWNKDCVRKNWYPHDHKDFGYSDEDYMHVKNDERIHYYSSTTKYTDGSTSSSSTTIVMDINNNRFIKKPDDITESN